MPKLVDRLGLVAWAAIATTIDLSIGRASWQLSRGHGLACHFSATPSAAQQKHREAMTSKSNVACGRARTLSRAINPLVPIGAGLGRGTSDGGMEPGTRWMKK